MITCNVSVRDAGGLSATVPLYININDINDNSPRFDKKFYTYHITPNEPVGTVLGLILLTDNDLTDPHNRIVDIWFENQPQDNSGQDYFEYNNLTSEITVAQNLSQYWYGSYLEFVLKARDYEGLRGTASVTVLFSAVCTNSFHLCLKSPSLSHIYGVNLGSIFNYLLYYRSMLRLVLSTCRIHVKFEMFCLSGLSRRWYM